MSRPAVLPLGALGLLKARCLSLGPPLDSVGYLGKVPFYLAALGSAGIGGIVPSGAA